MKQHTISLCMIVKDEEKYIGNCLKSARDKVDEMIVVDTGSTDNTKRIAKQYGAIVKDFEWTGDFSKARNYSLQFASSDYILILDADEFLDRRVNFEEDLISNKDYYLYQIRNQGDVGQAYYHQAIRLFKNLIGLKYYGKIHEHLTVHDGHYTFSNSNNLIHHLGYREQNIVEKDKETRNLHLLLSEVKENPTGYNYYNLGKQYKGMGKYDLALENFKKSYHQSKNKSYLSELLFHMADCLRNLNRFEEGLKIASDAIQLFPNYTDLYFVQGSLFKDFHYYKEAVDAFNTCLEIGEERNSGSREGVGSYLSTFQIATIYDSLHNRLEAFEYLHNTLEYNRRFLNALKSYLDLTLKTKLPHGEVVKYIKQIYNLENLTELKDILSVIYQTRHPILQDFLENINNTDIEIENKMKAVAAQYSKQYQLAHRYWGSIEVGAENEQDIILLSYIQGKTVLLEKLSLQENYNHKEIKIIKNIINREEVSKAKISDRLQNLMLDMAMHLVRMEEYKAFDYLSKIIIQHTSRETKYRLAKILFDYSFYDAALEVSIRINNEYPQDLKVKELIADICVVEEKYNDAVAIYFDVVKKKEQYPILSKIYDIFEQIGNDEGLRLIRQEILAKYPLSYLNQSYIL